MESQINKKSKGKNCFQSGKKYQHNIFEKLCNIEINGNKYKIEEVEGAKSGSDIVLSIGDLKIGFEIKNKGAFEGGTKK